MGDFLSIEAQVLDRLTATKGNAGAVAKELSLSTSYVARVKRDKWSLPLLAEPDPPMALVPKQPGEMMTALTALREQVVASLVQDLNNDIVEPKVKVHLLRVLLAHEVESSGSRKQTPIQANQFNILIEKFGQFDKSMLRELAPNVPLVDEGEIIDVWARDLQNIS